MCATDFGCPPPLLTAVALLPSREELQQPVFAAIDALEFPELHDESIPTLAFIKHLSRLMTASGVRDFSLKASPEHAACASMRQLLELEAAVGTCRSGGAR